MLTSLLQNALGPTSNLLIDCFYINEIVYAEAWGAFYEGLWYNNYFVTWS